MIEIDPTLFVDSNFFATTGTLNGVDVVGNFGSDYFEDVGGVGIAGQMPTFQVVTADVPALALGQSFVHSGVNYEVVGYKDEVNAKLTTLILMEV